MTEQEREDWEKSLIAFLAKPPAPKPKGARARRVTRRQRPQQDKRCAYS